MARLQRAAVLISVLGLFLMGIGYLLGVAVSASLAVLVVMAAAVTLLQEALDARAGLRRPRALGRLPDDADGVARAAGEAFLDERRGTLGLRALRAEVGPIGTCEHGRDRDGGDQRRHPRHDHAPAAPMHQGAEPAEPAMVAAGHEACGVTCW
jgi:hypothetical protein